MNGFLEEAGREMAIAHGGGHIPMLQNFFHGEQLDSGPHLAIRRL